MGTEQLIPLQQFCSFHEIEVSFVSALGENGLIQITTVAEQQYIPEEQLRDLEQMVRLYHDLDINLEGIEAIAYLLERVHDMQSELAALRARLRFYERD